MHRHHKDLRWAGKPLAEASKAMMFIHGRGATAESILKLGDHLAVENFALVAPQAHSYTWYPNSFIAPREANEPGLSTALELIQEIVQDLEAAGISKRDIYFAGFSQGACLTSEFLAQHAEGFGGAFLFSGGVIGPELREDLYQGNFEGMPVFLGCSDVDAHIPLHRVKDTTRILTGLGAEVTEKIYPGAPHTILRDELVVANQLLVARKAAV
ncbi:MAG: phospholipase [Bacteroidota bacterium]